VPQILHRFSDVPSFESIICTVVIYDDQNIQSKTAGPFRVRLL